MKTESKNLAEQLPEQPSGELQPCHHMTNLVSRRSDDSLSGPAKWYTDFHVMTCPSCKAALKGLRELRSEVAAHAAEAPTDQPQLSPEQWEKVREGWQENPSS